MENSLDTICHQIESAETLNALHACREGHPLGVGLDGTPLNKQLLFNNAAFMVAHYLGINSSEVEWLEKQAKTFANVAYSE